MRSDPQLSEAIVIGLRCVPIKLILFKLALSANERTRETVFLIGNRGLINVGIVNHWLIY